MNDRIGKTVSPVKYGLVLAGIALIVIQMACSTLSPPTMPPPSPTTSLPPTPTASPGPIASSTSPPSPTVTQTPTPAASPTIKPSPTPRPSPTATRTPRHTRTPIPEPTLTPLPEPFRRVGPIADILPGELEGLHTGCDGALWLATDQGVAKLEGDDWSLQLTGFTGNLVGVDGDNHIWVISEDYSEIAAWDGNAWTAYGAEAGWVSMADFWYEDTMRWGQCDPAGRFWLATTQDIRVFDGEKWTVFTSQAMGMGEVPDPEGCAPSFEMALSKSTGSIWVGECDYAEGPCGGQGVRWFDGSVWRGADSPASQGCAAAIQEDFAGNVWLGVYGTLWRYAPTSGDWASFAPPEEVPYEYRSHAAILDLAADPFGRIWVTELLCGAASCDAEALYYVQDGTWTLLPRGEDEYYIPTLHILTDAAGAVWLFGDNVYRLTATDFELAADLLPISAAVDDAGRVWFITRDDPQAMLCTLETDK